MQKQKDMKKAEKLQASLHLLDADNEDAAGSKRKHTIFVQSKKDAQEFDVAEHFDTIPEFEGRAFNRLRKREIEKASLRRRTCSLPHRGCKGGSELWPCTKPNYVQLCTKSSFGHVQSPLP